MKLKYLIASLLTLMVIHVFAQHDEKDTANQLPEFEYLFPPKKKPQSSHTDTAKYDLYDFYDMSLDELKNVKATGVSPELEKFINDLISVSTQKKLSTRNNPNIVTLISEEEIKNSGARDLLDVLRLVPGYHFALDRDGRVGLGVRGNWANEGKVLLMVNGIEMNDIYASNLYFGNEFPVELIERIEIIRGPGSSIYGGFAEFGVINIITKTVNSISGVSLNTMYGRMDHSTGRFTQSMYIGNKWKKTSFSIIGYNGIGQRTDRSNYAFYKDDLIPELGFGDYATLKGNSDINPKFSQMQFTFKDFTFTSTNSFYDVTNVTKMNENKKRTDRWGATISNNQFKYKFKVNDKLKIIPSANIKMSFPHSEEIETAKARKVNEIEGNVRRLKSSIFADYDHTHRTNFVGGIEFYRDKAKANRSNRFYIGSKDVHYDNIGAYVQGLFRLPEANITVGARYDHNSSFGHSFVPRFGVTKDFNRFHIKGLVSQAYRAPTVGNIAKSIAEEPNIRWNEDSTNILWDSGIEPERTLVIEGEIGFRINDKMQLTANVYDITTKNPIVYHYYQNPMITQMTGYDEAGMELYKNFDYSGSSGAEFDFRYRNTWGYFDLNYSYYTVEHKPRVPVYGVRLFSWDEEERFEVEENALLAFPKHKVNANLCYYIDEDFSANISATYFGKRYAYDLILDSDNIDEDFDQIVPSGELIEYKPEILTNIFLRWNNLFTKGLHFGLGAYNVFNTRYEFVQPYYGINVPLPGPTREFVFRLSYNLKFK